jgi:hypothetical protein
VERVRAAWASAGREGDPRITGLAYFALDDDAGRGPDALRDYYAFVGPYAEAIATSAFTTPDAIRDGIEASRAAGFDELILVATIGDPDQADLLADVVAG